MSTVERLNQVSVEDYLAGELASRAKHEYLGGVVYAMVGGGNTHNLIASNTIVSVGGRLRGNPCRAYNSDTKIRIRLASQVRFYYPDTSVICRPNPRTDSYHDEPAVIFEVLSPTTRRIDQGEKNDAYLAIPSLMVYALVESELAKVVVYRRRGKDFVPEVYEGLVAVLPLPEIGIELPLAEIYDAVEFLPEPEETAD